MSDLSLTATKRIKKTTLSDSQIPAVIYGRDVDSQAITLDNSAFNHLFEQAGEATIFNLELDGENHDVLIHDFQRHPVTHNVSHVDLYVIQAGQMITVSVPLEFIGVAPVVDNNGQVVKVLHEIEVECEPRNLPSHIDVDVTTLVNVGDVIHVSDLNLGEGVIASLDPEEVVVSTAETKEIEEDEVEDSEIDLSTIEVEGQDDTEDVADDA